MKTVTESRYSSVRNSKMQYGCLEKICPKGKAEHNYYGIKTMKNIYFMEDGYSS